MNPIALRYYFKQRAVGTKPATAWMNAINLDAYLHASFPLCCWSI